MRSLPSTSWRRIGTVAFAALLAIQLIPAPAVAQESRAITVFSARKIVTMDPG